MSDDNEIAKKLRKLNRMLETVAFHTYITKI
jgi:hypothetical protein